MPVVILLVMLVKFCCGYIEIILNELLIPNEFISKNFNILGIIKYLQYQNIK